MLKNSVEEKVNNWSKKDETFRELNHKIIHLEKRLYYDYMPCQPPEPQFFYRLKKWLENSTSEDDQKLLFQLIPELFYIGAAEFASLYRAAYNVEVARWLIDVLGIKFTDANISKVLSDAAEETWFCAATDSFRINDFFKINRIPSKYDLRPDWHSLTQLGDLTSIKTYIVAQGISRVVMLEDFVGSGSQVVSRIEYLCNNFPGIDVLIVSLITCPTGVIEFEKLIAKYPNLTIRHVVKVPESVFIPFTPKAGELAIHSETREMATRLYSKTTDGKTASTQKPYYPLGYKKTGALVVLHTNTPDNTLPLIHWQSSTWYPLFKRITRL